MADVPTNCGSLTQQTYEIVKFNGGPDIQQGHIPYFHSMLCQWAYNIAQSFSFVIIIEAPNKDFLLKEIQSHVPTLEPVGWDIKDIVNDTWQDATQTTVGCIFAEGVRLPSETTTIDHVGITEGSRRGFINAPIVTGRSDFDTLDVGFIETNQSFVDGVLRPWTILAAHKGLLATKANESIKSIIHVYQLARAMNENENIIRKNIIRKHWQFKDCVPINIASEDITYANVSSYPKKQVQFVYNSYNLVGTPSITD